MTPPDEGLETIRGLSRAARWLTWAIILYTLSGIVLVWRMLR